MRAYSELYIDDASCNLGEYLECMTFDMDYSIDEAFDMFAYSSVGFGFADGDPKYVTGMSGLELARALLYECTGEWKTIPSKYRIDKSSVYWTGWALAQYQWEKNILFPEMIEYGLKASVVEKMYILHEADISKFITEADMIVKQHQKSGVKRDRYR